MLRLLLVLMIGSLCGCASKGEKSKPDPRAAAIRADFKLVQMGMSRVKVRELLGAPLFSVQQPQPQTFPEKYDGPKDRKLTYVLYESYYPPPAIKRTMNSSYMLEGFIIYYSEADTVVHKVLHPELR